MPIGPFEKKPSGDCIGVKSSIDLKVGFP